MKTDKKKYTIGILTNHVEGTFQASFWPGMLHVAELRDINLVFFSGFSVNSPNRYSANFNIIYDLVSRQHVDGLIIFTNVLCHYLNDDELACFLSKFSEFPFVTIAQTNFDYPFVAVESQTGFRDAIHHLVVDHGFEKFVYINGNEFLPETHTRLDACKHNLRSHGISLEPDFIFPGDYTISSGYLSATRLLEHKYRDVDAIIAANDEMALGAMNFLSENDIHVPKDIAIIGFDNLDYTRICTPSLTTVAQPIHKQGISALNMLLDILDGKEIERQIYLPSRFIVRQSCGCVAKPVKHYLAEQGKKLSSFSFAGEISGLNRAEIKDKVERELINFIEEKLGELQYILYDWLFDVIAFFLDTQINSVDHSMFFHLINACPVDDRIIVLDEVFFHDLLVKIRDVIFTHCEFLKKEYDSFKNLFIGAHFLISERMIRPTFYNYNKRISYEWHIRNISGLISGTTDLEHLAGIVHNYFSDVGINLCNIVLYKKPPVKSGIFTWQLPEKSNVLISYNKYKDIMIFDREMEMDTRQLLSDSLKIPADAQYRYLVMPLITCDEQFGYITYEFSTQNFSIYEVIRYLVSNCIKGASILENEKDMVLSLRSAKEKLEASNTRMKRLDKMKNDFITNLSHDFRSPIMIIQNTAEIGYHYDRELTRELVSKRYNAIINSACKLNASVDRLLDLAKIDADRLRCNIQQVKIAEFLNHMIETYKEMIVASNISVTGVMPPVEVDGFYSDIDKLEDILMNIMSNAVKFTDPLRGQVFVILIDEEKSIKIIVKDNGIGIDPDKIESIFSRYKQNEEGDTRAMTGVGIGLSYAKQLVEYLNGSIYVESEGKGRGASFILEFPKGVEVFLDDPYVDWVKNQY